ncbi:V-type proton ATPase subunit S1 [Adelges cooleyi]|uniref:V-type proton ATPase subunit S1 n=1 Tax=Adelges cooleyi TaxID=133065 RepID=UPI0021807BC5|nr:V-type proton ATPase subunit S1 [Adelges cooleyi]
MANYPLLFVLFGSLVCVHTSSVNQVPVMFFSCGQTDLDAMAKYQHAMSNEEFFDLLVKLSSTKVKLALFSEHSLSLEDFRWRGTDGQSAFPLLQAFVDRRFIPSVFQPNEAIQKLRENGYFFEDFKDDGVLPNLDKLVISTQLEDAKSSDNRQEMLSRHDSKIVQSFEKICEKYENVIGLFTGKRNSWIESNDIVHHLVARHLMALDDSNPLVLDGKGKALIYSSSYPTLSINDGPATDLKDTNTEVILDDSRDSLLKVIKSFLANGTKVTIRFRFEKQSFTWELKNIEFEGLNNNALLSPQNSIGALQDLSYFSEGPVVFSNNSVVLKFNGKFQVQPWMNTPSSGKAKFSEPQDQDAFFTPPILAGLFVTALMLFIVTWGIMMIMDIKTMDRFDDPKGKTISINVAE